MKSYSSKSSDFDENGKRKSDSARSRSQYDENGLLLPANQLYFNPLTGQRIPPLPVSPFFGPISSRWLSRPNSKAEQDAEKFAQNYESSNSTGTLLATNDASNGATLHASGAEAGVELTDEQKSQVDSALHENGNPLPDAQRKSLESALGHDLSKVRLHTGDSASKAANSIHAKAFTAGNDIVFGKDQYKPGTKEGDRLIAHETAHVTQGNMRTISRKPKESDNGKPVRRTVEYGLIYITEIGSFFVPSNSFYSLLYHTVWAKKIDK